MEAQPGCEMPAHAKPTLRPEIAHMLLVDVMGYSVASKTGLSP
jgi:hypothetical protein